MARPDLRHHENAAGDWFVDTRCIDCGTCREVAPELFRQARGVSVVRRQPGPTAADTQAVWLAAQACPTSSIGTQSRQRRPGRLYPHEIAPSTGVFSCGYNAPESFGASAWFLTRPDGNLLVDSPRFTSALAKPFAEAGGLAHILLTHQDDVADADRWAAEFGARVWIHVADQRAAPYATDVVDGTEPVTIAPGVDMIPTPGHTRGSVVFLVDDCYLFTGDSLAWSHERQQLIAFRNACWYSWSAQTQSLATLADRRFEWVLPGHGAATHGTATALGDSLQALLARMADGHG